MQKTRFSVGKTWKIDSEFARAIASYDVKWGEQVDLLYARSIFCSEGTNKRQDGFLRTFLVKNYKSAINKFVDYEHDEHGENKNGVNPDKYHIIGHIYGSYMASQETGEIIPDEECIIADDGLPFEKDSKWRGVKLDILVDWVLYEFEFPEVADEVRNTESNENTKFGVSMEVYFKDFKMCVGDFDTNETFDYDGKKENRLEAKKGTPIANVLMEFWKKKMTYGGKKIYRILGNEGFFSGMAVTASRANLRSWNIATASDTVDGFVEANIDNKKLVDIIKSVASRGQFTCELEDGQPNCECVEKAISSELRLFRENITKLTGVLEKIAASDSDDFTEDWKFDEDMELTEEQLERLIEKLEEGEASSDKSVKCNKDKYNPEQKKIIKDTFVMAWKMAKGTVSQR